MAIQLFIFLLLIVGLIYQSKKRSIRDEERKNSYDFIPMGRFLDNLIKLKQINPTNNYELLFEFIESSEYFGGEEFLGQDIRDIISDLGADYSVSGLLKQNEIPIEDFNPLLFEILTNIPNKDQKASLLDGNDIIKATQNIDLTTRMNFIIDNQFYSHNEKIGIIVYFLSETWCLLLRLWIFSTVKKY
jgi:hypothetical protein